MSQKETKEKSQSLISVSPKLNREIVSRLEEQYHIHSYDIQANAIKKENGIHILIYFGEHFTHKEDAFFTYEQINQISDEIKEFIEKTGEACKQVLIDDYYKMMAPKSS
ncbi:hypothetical protein [Alkalibacillus aidingensis]|uniref:hypothetical protein n=1 Tax=Alkalibacillus aidingensis TaxID=2747607 RepID=UPI0016610F3E|nr:hypothetical protein [Alkalibacillus aidingensis]